LVHLTTFLIVAASDYRASNDNIIMKESNVERIGRGSIWR